MCQISCPLKAEDVIYGSSHSQNNIECGIVVVEEDVSCSCGCPVKESDCSIEQYFDRSSCQCLCRDQSGRNECISRGMQWDPLLCMCICPPSRRTLCSTGYPYAFIDPCQCVPDSDWDWVDW